ncbi:hypothetical protein HD806DRAFT_516847 [Xylariaceae sp. AK1471]|nr:hypothetical protein HD806DRAFT_516847 [Xylariaceae sp. AK1471]
MVAQHNIPDWIASVLSSVNSPILEDAPELQASLESLEPEPPQHRERPTKRLRHDQALDTDTYSLPYNMPSTPPQSNTEVPIHPRGQKRGTDYVGSGDDGDMQVTDLDFTPKPNLRHHLLRNRSQSPTKRQKTTLKSIASLEKLEKPVRIEALSQASSLPIDVRSLYSEIKKAAGHKVGIVPSGVYDMVAALYDEIPSHFVRQPDHPVDVGSDAEAVHATLRRVVRATADSERSKRLEGGWNHHVHTPLLDLVFGSNLYDGDDPQDAQQVVVARFEAVMGATIAGDAIPLIQRSQMDQPDVACSVSLNTSANESDRGSVVDLEKVDLGDVHSRSGSKKVDYVAVMHISPKDALWKAIDTITFESKLGFGYVNQTIQLGILYSPIAVSIETKTSSSQDDPLIQLGLWTAAWHKRMSALRERRFPPPPKSYIPPGTISREKRRLVSVLQIEVVGHEWSVYFACDLGNSISIRGPVRLGSTADIVEAWTLITCLKHIKRWIETDFHQGIRAWFMDAGQDIAT